MARMFKADVGMYRPGVIVDLGDKDGVPIWGGGGLVERVLVHTAQCHAYMPTLSTTAGCMPHCVLASFPHPRIRVLSYTRYTLHAIRYTLMLAAPDGDLDHDNDHL